MLSSVAFSSYMLCCPFSSHINRCGMVILTTPSFSFSIMSSVPPRRAVAYTHASDLPTEFWAVLRQNEPAANIILPFAKKACKFPREDGKDQLWIILYDDAGNDVEFVLSCTKGLLGNYPIFVYTPKSSVQLAQEEDHTADSLLHLVLCLLREVPPQRVFSVFSVAKVAEKFAEIFEQHTQEQYGIRALKDLYYDATFAFCTDETLNKSSIPFHPLPESEDFLIALRRADMSNLAGIKTLCKGFSDTSASIAYTACRMNYNVFCADSRLIYLMTNVPSWRPEH